MLSHHDKVKVSSILDELLGAHTPLKENEHVHYCPFCHHHKKKLNINIETQKYHCWVCDAKGNKIYYLLKRLNADKSHLSVVQKIYGDDDISYKSQEEIQFDLRLPKEFKSLLVEPGGLNPLYKHATKYVRDRGITKQDIIKNNIGYCDTGMFAGRIIIPSYDKEGVLNYFIARTFFANEDYKYKNPIVSKNIVPLENQINWNEPITLVEGIFDAIAIKRNVIPLFGKFIPKKLHEAIMLNKVKEMKIMLDGDAQKQALYYVDYYSKQGIKVTNIIPTDKDASSMGFETVNSVIKNTKQTTFADIINQKLKNL